MDLGHIHCYGKLVGFRYGKKHFVKTVTSLVAVLLNMTLCLFMHFEFAQKKRTRKKKHLSLFKIDTLNCTMTLQHRYFPVNIAKFLRTVFFF